VAVSEKEVKTQAAHAGANQAINRGDK